MFVIGLTGGIGSGKSEAARMFAALGVPVVDTDQIAHTLTATGQPVLQEIARDFGTDMLNPEGSLNRAALRKKVFADDGQRKKLEALLHPRIRARAAEMLAQHPEAAYQVLIVPLLFETRGYDALVTRSLLIDCDEALQIRRAMARSHMSAAEVQAVMAAQMTRDQRLALADDVISNADSLETLHEKVREKHEKYIKTCIVSQSIS